MTTATIEMELDVPEGIRILGCERHREGFVFEVDWEWPARSTCGTCGREQLSQFERKNKFRVLRDLDVWGQPGFWTYQVAFHRCRYCGHRQELIPPCRRPRAAYTYRFEEQVIRMAIGSTFEDVARRLSVSAEMVESILNAWASGEKKIDPTRTVTDIGLDEISLRKGHKMYVTILSDLSDPRQPRILAVAKGRDEEAARTCLEYLTEEQRKQIETHRTDMCKAYPGACAKLLPASCHVADRFHVAKRLGEVVDGLRKKSPAPINEHSRKKNARHFAAGCGSIAVGRRI